MNITNIIDDYDNITEYDNTTDTNDRNIDIIIPLLNIFNTMWSIIYLFNIPNGIYIN